MSYIDPPLKRFKKGDIVYMRCVVVGPGSDGAGPCAVLKQVDRMQKEVDEARRYAGERDLISMTDMIRAAKRMMER